MSNSKNNPIVITDVDGKKRTIQIVSLIGTNGELIEFTEGSLNVIMTDANGNQALINDDGQLHVVMEGCIDTGNTTTTPLLANETYIGAGLNVLAYAGIGVLVGSDVDGALSVEYSPNNIDWYLGETYDIIGGSDKFFSPPRQSAFYRLVYVNGQSDQSEFYIHPILSKNAFKWSSHNIDAPITDQDDAELVKAVITGKKANGDYDNVSLTNGSNMKVSLEELESGISTNSNSQLNTSPHIVDEYGNYSHQLGDNAFRGSIIAITPAHHEIHCGDSYTAHNIAELGNGASLNYLITTPNWGDPVNGNDPFGNQNIKVAHFIGEISGEAETQVWLYESPTVTTPGTALNVRNRNRNSANIDFLTITYGGTVSANGIELEHNQFGSGKVVGGGVNRSDEWILKNNTTYLVVITNNTTSNNYHTVRFQYYVHGGI